MLSDKAVKEYQEIYKKQYWEEISFEEAREQGMRFLRLMEIIYRPIPKEKQLVGR